MEFITSLQPWHWIILSLMLFGAEALGASGFLIGAGIAALGLGLLTLVVDGLSWELQATLFAVTAVACSIIVWPKASRPRSTIRSRSTVSPVSPTWATERATFRSRIDTPTISSRSRSTSTCRASNRIT